MDESYKIQLGVEVDVDDIQSQINKADVKPIPIKVEIENLNEIKQQLQNLGKDSKNSLTLNTSGVESALNDVKGIIADIKNSLGTLDSKSGMKDLLSSINQIAKALGKVEDESQNLVNSLNALSNKDFNINFGIKMGGNSFNNIAYGREARRSVLPQLKEQSAALTKMLGGEGKALLKLSSKYSDVDMFTYLSNLDTGSIIEQMEKYETHINRLKKLVVDGGGNLNSFNAQFSKSATELIDDVAGISKSADAAEESFAKLKNLFGGNNLNVEGLDGQLDSIVSELGEIKKVIKSFSEGVDVDKITQSFREMSEVLKDITNNLTIFKNAFGNVDNGLGGSISGAVQELKNGENILDSFKQSLKNIGMDDAKISNVANDIRNLGVQIETLNQSKSGIDPDKGILSVNISGLDNFGNAVKLTRQYNVETGDLIGSLNKVSTVHQKAGKSAETFAKQQQRAVTDLTNQINQVNRSAIDQNAARPIKETEHLHSLKAKYDEIIAAIARMGAASNETFEDERNKVKTLISEYKSLKSEYKNAENISMDLNGADFASGLEIAKNRLREFKANAQGFPQITQTIQNLDRAIEGVGDKSALDEFNNKLKAAKAELQAVKAETSGVSQIRLKLADKGFNGFEQEVQRVKNEVNALKQASPDLQEALRRLDAAMDAVSAADKAEDFQRLKVANEAYEKALKQVYSQLKLNQQAENNELKKVSFEAAKEGALLRLKGLFSENSQAARRFGSELDRIQKELNECGDSKGLTRINREITNLSRDVKNANVQTQTFGERFKKQWSQYTSYFSVASIFSYATQGLRSMFEQVKLIDSAMTELKKVTNETDAAYNKFLSNAAKKSKELGTTIDGLVSSTADFARLGYGFEDAQGLAEVANIYAVVGDEIEGVEGATESLISTMAAFKNEMNGMSDTDFAMSIIDKFNEIGNNFAISSGGIGEALERSASSLMAANNTIDESIALITAANTVVQDPTAVGTAFKTISMRIRGAKTELEEAGLETEGMVESTSTLRAEIEALTGVDIMEADGKTFKSTYAILDELSKKWKNLSDIQQATVTELIAGKRQGNIVSSLMANFDTAREALETSLGSEGSAMAEHAKWSESLEARLNKLASSWQAFSQTFMESDALKAGVDILAGFVDVLEKLVDTFGSLGTIGLGVAGKGLWSYFKGAKEAKAALNDVVDAIRETSQVEKEASSIAISSDQAEAAASELATNAERRENEENKKAILLENAERDANKSNVASETQEAAASAKSATEEKKENVENATAIINENAEAAANLNSANTEVAEGAKKSASAFGAFASSLSGWLAIAGIAITVVSALVQAQKDWREEQSQMRQEVIDSSNEFLEASDAFEQAYIKYSGRTDLTVEEEQELATAINGTIDALDDKSSKLQSVVNSSNDYVASLERIKRAELEAASQAAVDKKKNAALELEDATKNLFGSSKVNVFAYTDSTTLTEQAKAIKSAVDSVDSRFVQKNGNKYSSSFSFELSKNANIDEIIDYYYTLVEYKNKLDEASETQPDVLKHTTYKEVTKAIEAMSGAIETYESGVYDAAKAQYQLSNGIPKTTEEYLAMREAVLQSDDIKNLSLETRNEIANLLDSEYKSVFDLSSAEAQARKFVGLIKGYGDGTKDGSNEIGTVETFLNMRTAVNNNECSVGEYLAQFDEIDKMTANWSDEEKELLNTSFGLDTDSIKAQYDEMEQYLTRKIVLPVGDEYWTYHQSMDDIHSFLDGLTAEELTAVVDIRTEIDWGKSSAEDIRKQIEDRVKLNEALNFNASIEVDKTALEALNTALEESVSAMGLSEESIDSLKAKYSDLEGYNPHTLFERTANGVKVNREELAKLEKKYNDLTKTEVQEHLDTLVEEYNKCTKAIDGNIGSQEKLELISKREKYAQQIEELAEYQAQLEGVTGAYQRWIDAQNTPEDYEGYQAVATSREDIEDEISRGFLSNSTKEYIDLLSGKDLVGGSIDDYYNAWKRLDEKVGSTSYSINDFFTVNEDGDITSTGIDRFFKGLQQDFKGSIAEFNKETGQWEYDFSQENLQKIQDEWGIGIEAIELLLEAAASAGYDVDWGGMFDNLDIDVSNFESVEAMISLAEKAQEEFNKIKGVEDIELNFRTNNVEEATAEVEKARKAYVDLITNDDGSINLKAEGAEQMQFMLATLLTQKQRLSTPAIMKVDTSQIDKAETDIIDVINKAKSLQTAYENYEIAITTGVDVESAKADLNSAIEGMKGTSVDVRADLKMPTNEELTNAANGIGSIKVGATLDGTAIGDIATKIQTECTPEVIAKVTGLDETAIQNGSQQVVYTAEHSDVDNFINGLSDISKKIIYTYTTEGTKPNPSNIERSITYKYKTEGDVPEVNGTANANGTANSSRAFAHGNWGIKGSGTALVGELGMETLVRGGRFYTIGDNGAEFIKYQQGDIIFNHKQTEELFKYGKVTSDSGRGKMFANGSAFVEGTALWQATASGSKFAANRLTRVEKTDGSSGKKTTKDNSKKDNISVSTTVTKDNDSTSVKTNVSAKATESDFAQNNQKNEKDTDKFEETFDWISIAIDRIEREIDGLDKKANNVYNSWSERNSALASEITEVGKEIRLQSNAAKKYLAEANAVGLDESYAKKVREGTLKIEDFEGKKDEALVEKIKEYEKWYELYLKCADAAENLKETEAELYAQRVENAKARYDGILGVIEHEKDILDEYISQAEAQGHLVSAKYYNALVSNEKQNKAQLTNQKNAMLAELQTAMQSGKIVKGSEGYYEMVESINDVTLAIAQSETAILEYQQTIQQLKWEQFDLLHEKISAVTEEADFLIDLMSNDKLFDDKGKLTSQGMATMGLHGQNYNTYMYQADLVAKEIERLKKELAKDPYDTELEERYREMISLQQEYILSAEDEKEAIRDLVSEGIEIELDALQELIDKENEALESERNLYEYQKKVKEQTKEIASLEKQMAAYSGDDSEEARQKIQQIKVELETAKEDLQESEYDKYISDQQQLLDELYIEYETILNTRLDNIDALMTDMIAEINTNASTISNTLSMEAANVGAKLSESMQTIWTHEGGTNSIIADYGKKFTDKQTTTNTALSNIETKLKSIITHLGIEANKDIKDADSSSADDSKEGNEKPSWVNAAANATITAVKSAVIKPGSYVNAGNAQIYDHIGAVGERQLYRDDPKYQVLQRDGNWVQVRHHTLKSGVSGWFKFDDIKPYATGKKNFENDEIAWTQEKGREFIVRPSDGAILTPIAKGDSVLTSAASNNIWDMANSPTEFIKDNLKLGTTSVPNNSTVQSNYTQHLDKVVFNLPNVKNYDELLSAMQKDKNFERLILSMSIDRLTGKSGLAKNKSIR